MRVGIMSMQRICNYGSFLQSYCLKKMIESLGHEVEYVDYKPGKPILSDDYTNSMYFKSVVREFVMDIAVKIEPLCFFAPESVRRSLRFKHNYNNKYLPMLGIGKKITKNAVDTLVIGSDEVFNCFQKNPKVGFSRELFGENHRAKRLISYAGSFGNTTIEEIEHAQLNQDLSGLFGKFDAISVRDDNSAGVICALTGNVPEIHMDPVLMCDFSNDVPRVCDMKNYMVVYAYRGRLTDAEIESIKAFAKMKGLKTVSVGGVQPFCDMYIEGSPLEIIDYIKNAEYVVTDTFHGTIFSVINHRKFVSFVRSGHGKAYGNQEKLVDLLVRLGLKNRSVSNTTEFSDIIDEPIDYKAVDDVIVEQRKSAMEYLKNNL